MLFTTLEFVVFLSLAVVCYYILPKKFQWLVLLGASLAFYIGLGRRRVVFVLISAVSTWLTANVLHHFNSQEKQLLAAGKATMTKEEKSAVKASFRVKKRFVMAGFLLVNIGGLAFFKFYNLAADTFSALPAMKIIMPVGISFYTLQITGYVLDVYNKKTVPEKNILKTVLFTTFFPQIMLGPINRFDKLQPQLLAQRSFDYDKFILGLLRMMWGYFKKLVIADRFAVIVATLFDNSSRYQGFEIVIVVFFYTIQLYADFSGGIDIACGAAELFGIELPENFMRPFFSKSISEFWRRWHITLGAWLRDYVFYPVTLSKPLSKLGKFLNARVGKWFGRWIPAYISLFILWLCSGIWHGEGMQFIAYGLYHGTIIMLGMTFEPLFNKLFDKVHLNTHSQSWKILQVCRTFTLVCLGELIFRSASVSQAVQMIKSIFSAWNPWVFFNGFIYTLGLDKADVTVGIIAIIVLFAVSLLNRKQSMRMWVKTRELPIRWAICLFAIWFIVVFGVYGPGYEHVPFIYFQF